MHKSKKISGKDYMMPLEYAAFKKDNEAGKITFFKIAFCENCEKEIYAGNRFCSLKCSTEYGVKNETRRR